MNFISRSISCLTLVSLLACLATAGTANAGLSNDCVVRIDATAITDLQGIGLEPRLEIDYGSFRWLELSSADLDLLQRAGVPFTKIQGATAVQVLGFVFDPLTEGEPALPDNLRGNAGVPGFRLVQLVGPPKSEWVAALEGAGVTPLQYYPHNTFLVWGATDVSEAVEPLDFVRWNGLFHPGYKISPNLQGRTGVIRNVDIVFHNGGKPEDTLSALRNLGVSIVTAHPAQPDKVLFDAVAEIDASLIETVAQMPSVLWIGHSSPEPALDDEMSSSIVGGNYADGVPLTEYQPFLGSIGGYDGSGVIWSITDTGVDYDHPDLNIVGGYNYPGCVETNPGDDPSSGGHGTHVAGIVGGNATGGFSDANGFLYGLGVAPGYSIFAQNPICGTQSSWPPAGGWQELSKQGVLGSAIGANNSWTSGDGTAHGYQAIERTHDFMVRDGNFDTASAAEPYIIVFSAGNSGPGSQTLTSPKEAKNVIVTAGTQNYRVSSDIDAMYNSSSRGPAVDGRFVPTIATPGQEIASARNDRGGLCATSIAGTNNLYAYCTGTSMAAPHTSGSIAILTEWWRTNRGGDPSPAMSKALLVNGAVDITGAAPIPNFDEGWGRVHLEHIIAPSATVEYWDQENILDTTGDVWTVTVGVPDGAEPLKISLAWTDAPGAIGANPALVNDLDLTVETGGTTYLGNDFSGGWSATGGSADTLNNLENVFVQTHGGSAVITVTASNIAGDGVPLVGDLTDQDFALVCSNCLEEADFTLDVSPAAQSICAPTDAVYTADVGALLGFTDAVTLTATGNPAGTTAVFGTNPVTPPGTSTLTIGGTSGAAGGSYSVAVEGTSTTGAKTRTVSLNLFDLAPAATTLLSPADGAIGVAVAPTYTWSLSADAETYEIEVATDPGFTNIVDSASGLTGDSFVGQVLTITTQYFWRMRATNICGGGTWSTPYSFTTANIACLTFDATDVPKVIPEGGGTSGTTTSLLTIAESGPITSLSVGLHGTHTYMGDLDFDLTSPDGTTVRIMDTVSCGGGDDFDLTLDDNATNPFPCPPVGGGTYLPSNPLAVFVDEELSGDWTLLITDNYGGDEGTLDTWEIQVCFEQPFVDAPVFSDGFESGDTSGWDQTIPPGT